MKKTTIFIVCSLAIAPAWAINKCTDTGGKVVYQDAPCAGGKGQALNIQAAPSNTSSDVATGEAQARLNKLKSDNEMSAAIRLHEPLIGMTAAQLDSAMGMPTKVNAGNYGGSQQDQLIYERPNETWYVYTRNGVVQSIQLRAGPPLGAAPVRASGRCASKHEINNAITSASSMLLSERERAERWKTIRAMQGCGT